VLSAHPDPDVAGELVTVFWDGLFHLATVTLTIAGIALAWRARRRTDASHP